MDSKIPNTLLVIFGVTGDLSGRYLLPGLAEIERKLALGSRIKVLGVSRQRISKSDILRSKTSSLRKNLDLIQIDYNSPKDYQKLKNHLQKYSVEQVIFYLALPSKAVEFVINNLGGVGLNAPKYRLLLEKPFGMDLKSAKKVIKAANKYFTEDQIYRIDHYLAKEMAQNVASFLGNNAIFRDVWSSRYISKIEILVEQSIDIEGRASFYEQTGALRDIVQSHALQLAALVLMKPDTDVNDYSQMRHRRLKVLKKLRLAGSAADVIRGQYDSYTQEANNLSSQTETFVSLSLQSKEPRWVGVPIVITTGKSLDKRRTAIIVSFKRGNTLEANRLIFQIQPEEGIILELWVKRPGYEDELQKANLSFSYAHEYKRLPDAYERVLVDAMRSRSNLFPINQEILASWKIVDPILGYWQQNLSAITKYKSGCTSKDVLTQLKARV